MNGKENITETDSLTRGKKLLSSALAIFVMLCIAFLISFSSIAIATLFQPSCADAAIYVGDTKIDGYEPDDIVQTDTDLSNMNPNEAADKIEDVIVRLIKIMMPFLMLACVGIIIYNAIRNLVYFRQQEKRVSMGALLKNMVIQYFFILGAFIIVEVIVFIVSGGQSLLFEIIMGS